MLIQCIYLKFYMPCLFHFILNSRIVSGANNNELTIGGITFATLEFGQCLELDRTSSQFDLLETSGPSMVTHLSYETDDVGTYFHIRHAIRVCFMFCNMFYNSC